MDKLEEHIRKNRRDLDRYTPSPAIWDSIKRRLKSEKSSNRRWLSIAAMVMVIISSGVLINRYVKRSSDNIIISSDEGLKEFNPQINETEIYYNNLINSLYLEASPLLVANPEIEKELTSDISQLDSISSEIKKDLKDNIANQEVIEALIQNYRIKIRLLEDMLILMKENEDNPEKNKTYEI